MSLVYLFRFAPGARCCCCGSCGFMLLLLLRVATPPRPPFWGGGKYQKESPVASALAVGHVGVCVGVMEVAVQCKNYTSEV